MASTEYHHGDMDIHSQKATWDGFMKAAAYGSILTLISVGFLTLVFAMGMNWFISLVLMVLLGAAIGFVMNMGSAWVITLVLFAATVFISRIVIGLFQLFL